MPLRCLANGLDMFAYAFDSAEFEKLRVENARSAHLKMVCCDSRVTLRTSQLGTHHFSHARKGDCTTVPESSEYLLAKLHIALAVTQAGWTAQTEARGQLASGQWWAADVLATQEGHPPMAFQVQWARQSPQRVAERTAACANAGITAVWLMRQNDFSCEGAAPAVRLIFNEEKSFDVTLASAQYSAEEPSARTRDYPQNWRQRMPLEQFVEQALASRLQFGTPESPRANLVVHGARVACWLCQKLTRLVLAIEVKHSLVVPGAVDHRFTLADFDTEFQYRDFLMTTLPPELLRLYGIGALKPRSSKMSGDIYFSNGCVHCDALQGRFFDHEVAYEEAPIARVVTDNTQVLRRLIAKSQTPRWWLLEHQEISAATHAIEEPVHHHAPIKQLARLGASAEKQMDLFENAST